MIAHRLERALESKKNAGLSPGPGKHFFTDILFIHITLYN